MREIKFRAWDKKNKQMWQSDKLCFVIRAGVLPESHDFMQYTGLKDKNGKEIYEGDIVREDNPYTSLSGGAEVIFEEEQLQIGVVDTDDYFVALADIKGEWEVIGNIYENKELLEVKNGKQT